MKLIMQTDVYEQTAKSFAVMQKIYNLTHKKVGKVLSYDDLVDTFNAMIRHKANKALAMKMIESIKSGDMVLTYCENIGDSLPPFIPFIKYRDDEGNTKVLVDMTLVLSEKDGYYTPTSIKAIYPLLEVAFFTLKLFDAKTILPSDTIETTAIMWAKMFCKVLNKLTSLGMNRERYEAFVYFAIQFYCRYILETPIITANNIAEGYLKNGKSDLIKSIEGDVRLQEIDMYGGFKNFCDTLFNYDITGLRSGLRGSKSELNYVTYMSAFMHEYDKSSLYGLAAFPYFLLMIARVNEGSPNINQRSLKEVLEDPQKYQRNIEKELEKDL